MWYNKIVKKIRCKLCPKSCLIREGERGDCRIRININGRLYTVVYARPCSIHIDPVEKKPLFHFYPGFPILSLATAGCNLHCKNCQNWEISQADPENIPAYRLRPEDIVAIARNEGCNLIAYTYTEPLTFYEYSLDTSIIAKAYDMKNVLVTAGYLNRKPLKKLYQYTDAINCDLKFFNDEMYRKITTATLKPVLDAMILAKEMDVWLEVTNLIIPTLNDNFAEIRRMCIWIRDNLGKDTPLHFSRFFPRYLLRNLPITPYSTLARAREIALEVGLNYVYIGNVFGSEAENTYCPYDKKLLIRRIGYKILENNIKDGKCKYCGKIIAGRWS